MCVKECWQSFALQPGLLFYFLSLFHSFSFALLLLYPTVQSLLRESQVIRQSKDKQIAELKKMLDQSADSLKNEWEKKVRLGWNVFDFYRSLWRSFIYLFPPRRLYRAQGLLFKFQDEEKPSSELHLLWRKKTFCMFSSVSSGAWCLCTSLCLKSFFLWASHCSVQWIYSLSWPFAGQLQNAHKSHKITVHACGDIFPPRCVPCSRPGCGFCSNATSTCSWKLTRQNSLCSLGARSRLFCLLLLVTAVDTVWRLGLGEAHLNSPWGVVVW